MRFRFTLRPMTLDDLDLLDLGEFSRNFAGFRRFGRQQKQLLNELPVLSATAL